MYKFSILLMFVLAFSCVGFSSTGLPNEISNIHFENVTQTSVDVVWTTAHPSTSQVVLTLDTTYDPHRLIPAIADPALVTAHRVTVDHLAPYRAGTGIGQYYIYVVSVTAGGQMSTAPGPQTGDGKNPLISMRTLPTNFAGTPNMLVYTSGPTRAYTGHDMYFQVQPILVSGPVAHLYIQNVGGYNNGTDGVVTGAVNNIRVHYSCLTGNKTTNDANDQWLNRTLGLGYCYMGNSDPRHEVRLRVPANATPGPYTVTLTLKSNGQTVSVPYSFTVVQTPTSVQSVPHTPTTIPGLSTWETQMVTLGNKWCTFRDQQDANGIFEPPYGYEGTAWYYDGGRVFEQIDDYTSGVLNQPNHPHWQHCAQAILYPYAYYVVDIHAGMGMWKIFSAGMAMNYWRTHLSVMTDAVDEEATHGLGKSQGYIDPLYVREMAYSVNALITNAQLGAPVEPMLQIKIDKLIGMMIMTAEGTGSTGGEVHPFMIGLGADALSRWYKFSVAAGTPDYRVVPVLKSALDTLWATNWQGPTIPTMNYNRFELPTRTADDSVLNNLVSQGYAWLWYMTGDEASQQHAYDLFSNAFHCGKDCYDLNGKVFSQNFALSFDTVRLLQNNGMSYTDPASNIFDGDWPVTTPPEPKYGSIVGGSTVTWQTYVLASSQVVYGTTTAYGMQTAVSDTSGVLAHSVTLPGLLPATTYHFRVKSVDMMGNASQSADQTFKTP